MTNEAAAAKKDGWWVKVIKQKTEAKAIKLEIGLGGNDASHKPWTTWKSADDAEFDVPDEFKSVAEIWIKGIADPEDRNVDMEIYYKDRCTQKMEFDADEEHEISQGDEC